MQQASGCTWHSPPHGRNYCCTRWASWRSRYRSERWIYDSQPVCAHEARRCSRGPFISLSARVVDVSSMGVDQTNAVLLLRVLQQDHQPRTSIFFGTHSVCYVVGALCERYAPASLFKRVASQYLEMCNKWLVQMLRVIRTLRDPQRRPGLHGRARLQSSAYPS